MINNTYTLYIAGSRYFRSSRNRADMTRYVQRAVDRAIEHGWHIIAGDNPLGVNDAVIQHCAARDYPHLTVVGITKSPRNRRTLRTAYRAIIPETKPSGRNACRIAYRVRDACMGNCANRGLFIWNRRSPGTKAAYEYMCRWSPDAPAHLITTYS